MRLSAMTEATLRDHVRARMWQPFVAGFAPGLLSEETLRSLSETLSPLLSEEAAGRLSRFVEHSCATPCDDEVRRLAMGNEAAFAAVHLLDRLVVAREPWEVDPARGVALVRASEGLSAAAGFQRPLVERLIRRRAKARALLAEAMTWRKTASGDDAARALQATYEQIRARQVLIRTYASGGDSRYLEELQASVDVALRFAERLVMERRASGPRFRRIVSELQRVHRRVQRERDVLATRLKTFSYEERMERMVSAIDTLCEEAWQSLPAADARPRIVAALELYRVLLRHLAHLSPADAVPELSAACIAVHELSVGSAMLRQER